MYKQKNGRSKTNEEYLKKYDKEKQKKESKHLG